MGNIIRSSSSGSEDQNSEFASLQYNYPPKNGHNYFANTYIMGNERFETSMPGREIERSLSISTFSFISISILF